MALAADTTLPGTLPGTGIGLDVEIGKGYVDLKVIER